MPPRLLRITFAIAAALLGAVVPAVAQSAATTVTLPTVTGPIAVTAESVPLMASSRLQNVVDLPAHGYVEEEFFVAGRADVYDWTPGGVSVKTSGAPYTTRILLRRPADARRFSGDVIVEIPNAARRFDFNFTWGVSHDHFMERGDVFVVLTLAPGNLDGLKAFDARRYAPLSLTNPTPDESCSTGRAGTPPQTATTEEGLQYDILAQVGALLKSPNAGGTLAGFDVRRVYLTAYDGALASYITAIHPRVRLAGGKPIYDGYVVHRHPALARLRRCGATPAPNDPRQIVRNVDVPVLRIIGQTDILTTYTQRREDADTPGDRYRLYEVAGGAHADGAFYPYIPTVADLRKIGSPFPLLAAWPFANQCDPEQSLARTPINGLVLDAAYDNLTRWVRDGVAPPRAARIAIEQAGTPQARVTLDQFGNAVGGTRTPYLEVPAATYFTSSKGETFCPELARTVPFDWARLQRLYGSPEKYAARVAKSADTLLRQRWLTEADARRLKAEAVVPAITSR